VSINPAKITVSDQGTVPPASPYPSTISISGLVGTVTGAKVDLVDINHPSLSDLDVLLVGPQGQKVLLMSDTCVGAYAHLNLGFSDSAVASLPAPPGSCTAGIYKPANNTGCDVGGDVLPSSAPGPPYAGALFAFAGTNPNGAWRLFAADSCAGSSGEITGGWVLTLDGPQSTPNPPKKKCKKKKKKETGEKSAASDSAATNTAAASKKKKKKCKKKKKKSS
jgi:subtilisin-like proprotein convertase family protein